jgi:L-fucose mutarotase
MLRSPLQHPEILCALARAGHGSKVLIADGHFPASTMLGPNARLVHLNLAPGNVGAVAILEVLAQAVALEKAEVMATLKTGPYALKGEPPIWKSFRKALAPAGVASLDPIAREGFYAAARSPDVALVIQSGETAIYANVLLTVGVTR